jgi:hypothetical protein
VDSVPDPLLLRKSGNAGNLTRTSRSVVKYSDHQTTEAVCDPLYALKIFLGWDFSNLNHEYIAFLYSMPLVGN